VPEAFSREAHFVAACDIVKHLSICNAVLKKWVILIYDIHGLIETASVV
jgi:hypothetical protein